MALETLVENINGAVNEHNGVDIDIKRLFGGFTMGTIIQVSYGIKVDSLNMTTIQLCLMPEGFPRMLLPESGHFLVPVGPLLVAKLLKLQFNLEVLPDFFKDSVENASSSVKKDLWVES